MTSIPLCCKICPKHPDFSDISHLLTHVGSKGHLSHYFKAQVRSRQEPLVRQQLEDYDCWYAQNQIERLLSQRMMLKEAKDTQAKPKTARKTTSVSTIAENVAKKPRRSRISSQRPSYGADVDEAIDPLLSQVQYSPKDPPFSSLELFLSNHTASEIASKHRAHVPCMRQQTKSPEVISPTAASQVSSGSMRKDVGLDMEEDCDYQASPSYASTKMTYPDPSTHSSLAQRHSSSQPASALEHEPEDANGTHDLDTEMSILCDEGSTQSSVLKGVQWPGMDIFDSASPEAQRKRNQKKNLSVIAQMELNSTSVEPLERIYWPEGRLKMERIITGNVESSPPKEESPKPKRRRQVSDKPILGDLSTNQPAINKKNKPRKPYTRRSPAQKLSRQKNTTSRHASLRDLSKRGSALLNPRASTDPKTLHSRIDAVDGESEWRLDPCDYHPRRNHNFAIHVDDDAEDERKHTTNSSRRTDKNMQYPFMQSMHDKPTVTSPLALSSHGLGLPFTLSNPYSSAISYPSYGRSSSTPKEPNGRLSRPAGTISSASKTNKENYRPNFDLDGQPDGGSPPALMGRKSQRYFSVNEAHSPQLFDFLPTQVEFGGLATSNFFGSSFNPLNPNAQFQHNQLLHGSNSGIATDTTSHGKTHTRRKLSSSLRTAID